jgi:hypothetical protein
MTAPGYIEQSLLIDNETEEMQEMFLLGKEYGYIYAKLMHQVKLDGPIRTKNIPRITQLLEEEKDFKSVQKYEITKCGPQDPKVWMWLKVFYNE